MVLVLSFTYRLAMINIFLLAKKKYRYDPVINIINLNLIAFIRQKYWIPIDNFVIVINFILFLPKNPMTHFDLLVTILLHLIHFWTTFLFTLLKLR